MSQIPVSRLCVPVSPQPPLLASWFLAVSQGWQSLHLLSLGDASELPACLTSGQAVLSSRFSMEQVWSPPGSSGLAVVFLLVTQEGGTGNVPIPLAATPMSCAEATAQVISKDA